MNLSSALRWEAAEGQFAVKRGALNSDIIGDETGFKTVHALAR
jgi:hypothetical protein